MDDLVDIQISMLRRVRAMETRAIPYFRWPPISADLPWTPVPLGAGYAGSLNYALKANRWALRFDISGTTSSPAAVVATLPPSVVLPGPKVLRARDNAHTEHKVLVAADGTITLDVPLSTGLRIGGYISWIL